MHGAPIKVLGLSLALVIAACGRPDAGQDLRCADCNLIVVSVDTLRADHLGCYGYARATSPNIDALCRESVVFDTAIAQSATTTASHGSIFTSRLPVHHGGLRARRQPISPEVPLLAEVLGAAGWRCASWNGGGAVAAMFGFDRGFEIYESTTREDSLGQKVEQALAWLGERAGTEPFFLFLHTYETHYPYQPNQSALELIAEGPQPPPLAVDRSRIRLGTMANSSLSVDEIVRLYDAEIRLADSALGALQAGLEAAGLWERTVLVFTSDHGEEFGEHGSLGEHSGILYDEVLRVPLIVKLPGSQLGGTRVAGVVRSLDIMPTVLDLLAQPAPQGLAGVTLVDRMLGREAPPLTAVSQLDGYETVAPAAVRTDDLKLILRPALLDDEAAMFHWFDGEAQTWAVGPHALLTLASEQAEAWIDVFVGGAPVDSLRITDQPRQFAVALPPGTGRQPLTLRAQGDCARERPAGDARDCPRFRLFNPYELFDLATDGGERDNRYGDPERVRAVTALRRSLAEQLAGTPASPGEELELDSKTLERLRALGYVD